MNERLARMYQKSQRELYDENEHMRAEIAAQTAEITRLTRALAEADEAGKASYSAGYSAGQAEIARFNNLLTDLNAAWRAERHGVRDGLGVDGSRLDGDTAVYLLHQRDKRYNPALPDTTEATQED